MNISQFFHIRDFLSWVREQANRNGFTSKEAYKRAGISRETVWRWQKGKCIPKQKTIDKLQKLFET